jgi:hypothetical protein
MRRDTRKVILFTILVGATTYATLDPRGEWLFAGGSSSASDRADTPTKGPQDAVTKEGAGRFALRERAPLGETQGALFGSRAWQPPPQAVVQAAPPPKPTPPPMPYKFAGKLLQDGKFQVFLSKGDATIPVWEGETLDGTYRVESIGEDRITLVYLPLKHKETIPVFSLIPNAGVQAQMAPQAAPSQVTTRVATGSTAGPASVITPGAPIPTSSIIAIDGRIQDKPAQLLWQGPQQVKLGSRFEVTLKVTSGQPLRASPMQIRFDPAYLEFVAAKPGKLFGGERNFSYRVDPGGSIFVGASNQNPVPLSDADLIVLVFKTVKTAPAAQLSVSSLSLQGPAGRPIAVSQLDTFRTVIFP